MTKKIFPYKNRNAVLTVHFLKVLNVQQNSIYDANVNLNKFLTFNQDMCFLEENVLID